MHPRLNSRIEPVFPIDSIKLGLVARNPVIGGCEQHSAFVILFLENMIYKHVIGDITAF